MQDLIKTATELEQYFQSLQKLSEYHFNKHLKKKIYVKSKVRADYLASEMQGRYFIKGEFYDTKFDNAGGGLWSAYIELAEL